ncbi:MAG: SGNH/GDSL hydrolase family protein [Cyclobacteriaceae bacterium]|nr:SGNH/GDSL hydrolase family protein [Cyclobacteriaceae bacterium]MDW8330054.1 SGNH/GDSL hydrolase family protein [Cyclobacteriaceae bacterium]
MQKSDRKPLYFLALGDSYTIGEAVADEERWPVQLAKLLQQKGFDVQPPEIIATTGWRTDQLKEAIMKGTQRNEYDMVSLLIGVNNQYQGRPVESYRPEFEELLRVAIQLAGGKKERVFVLSIPDYGFTPFGREKQQAISAGIDAYNAANKEISDNYGVQYFYITDLTRKGLEDSTLVAPDGLHPSGKMYALWAERIAAVF